MEFNLFTLIVAAALLLAIGAFIGVGLGRRSNTANKVYNVGRAELDKLQQRADDAEAKLRIAVAKLKDLGL